MTHSSSPSNHQDIFVLLPWYANGTLAPDEYKRVRQHVAECAVCHEELALLKKVYQAEQAPPVASAVAARGLENMMQLLEKQAQQPVPDDSLKVRIQRFVADWLTPRAQWAAAIPVMLVLVSVLWLVPRDAERAPHYETLSSGETVERAIVLALKTKAGVNAERLRRDLAVELPEAMLEVSSTGDYLLALPSTTSPETLLTIIDALQRHPLIRSATPVTDKNPAIYDDY